MGKTHCEKSETTDRQISRNTECNSEQIVAKANERPEWLPDGWHVDLRTRKSGAHMGSGYKCYIDPLNGYKFYSKPEVLRYLETLKDNSCTSKKNTTVHSPSNNCPTISPNSAQEQAYYESIKDAKTELSFPMVMVQKSTVEDLPPGWIKEFKIRKSSNGIKKDPYYTDPVSGYVFRSKKDALRYLESGDISACLYKPNKRQIQDDDSFTPSSAAKRQKAKQSAAKQQLFVGREVTGESSLKLPDANSSKIGQDVKVSDEIMVAPVPPDETVVEMHSLTADAGPNPPEIRTESDLDNVQEKNYIGNMMVGSNEKAYSNPGINTNKKQLNVPHRFSRRLAGIESDQLANTMINEEALQVSKRNSKKSGTTLDADLANTSSQWLNAVPEIEHVHDLSCMNMPMQGELPKKDQQLSRDEPHQPEGENTDDNKPKYQHALAQGSSLSSFKVPLKTSADELAALGNHPNDHGLASEASFLKEKEVQVSEIGKSNAQHIHSNSNKSGNKKEHCVPRRTSKRLAGYEPELMTKSLYCEKAPEYKSRKSKGETGAVLQQSEGGATTKLADPASINEELSNKSRKSPKTAVTTDKELEKLGDEEIDDEKAEAQLSFAFHYSSSDPCLEFAIKSLTGLLPVEDSAGNGPKLAPESDMFQKSKFKTFTGVLPVENQADGPKLAPESDIFQDNKFKTFTGVLPVEDQAGNGPKLASETEMFQNEKFKIVTCVLPVEDSAGNEPNVASETNMLQKNKLTESATRSNNDRLLVKKKSKNKKEFRVACRLSKRLAGLEPELAPAERALEYATRKSCKDETTKIATPTNGVSEHLYAGEAVERTNAFDSSKTRVHRETSGKSEKSCEATVLKEQTRQLEADSLKSGVHGESSNKKEKSHQAEQLQQLEVDSLKTVHGEFLNKSEKSYEVHTAPEVQLQLLQTEKIGHERAEPQFSLVFGDSWSDPCLEFAIKTLTGALPVDTTADILPVMTPDVDKSSNKELLETLVQKSINEVAHVDSNQSQNSEKLNLVCQPSKQLLGEPELRTGYTARENAPKIATRQSWDDETNIARNSAEGESLDIEAGNVTQHAFHSLNINTSIHEEPAKTIGRILEGKVVPTEQPQFETQTMKQEKPESQFCAPFMDSWSDPCLDFAFKTLTGAIPMEEILSSQGCFQEPSNNRCCGNGVSTLPDFGSPNFSQSDSSTHCDTGEKSMPVQQSSMSSSFLPK